MTIFCIISEIKRAIGQKSRFFHNYVLLHSTPQLGNSRRNSAISFGTEN